jgi:hypothetical protein
MPTQRRRILGLSIVFTLLCVFAILWSRITSYYDRVALEQAAQRIGVTPTYTDVARYVKESVRPGMSREEVEAVMRQVAPVEVLKRGKLTSSAALGPNACDELLLKVGPFSGNLEFSACYYGEGEALFNFEYKSS